MTEPDKKELKLSSLIMLLTGIILALIYTNFNFLDDIKLVVAADVFIVHPILLLLVFTAVLMLMNLIASVIQRSLRNNTVAAVPLLLLLAAYPLYSAFRFSAALSLVEGDAKIRLYSLLALLTIAGFLPVYRIWRLFRS